MRRCQVCKLGLIPYIRAYDLQLELVVKRQHGELPDQLLLLEHPPVFTLGRSGSREHILASRSTLDREGITVYETNRGGDITYHGPGQLVGYPILDLREHRKDLHWLLRCYEQVFINLLQAYGIEAERREGLTGVWVEGKKVLAIGVGVKRWVTFHGFAFNIDPNFKHFQMIIPCGLENRSITSLRELMGSGTPAREKIEGDVARFFAEVFDLEVEWVEVPPYS